jgi:hypothetical protein
MKIDFLSLEQRFTARFETRISASCRHESFLVF